MTVFYPLYIAFLKKDASFALRRYFLLVAIVFSFVYPFVAVSAWENIIPSEKPQGYTARVMTGEPSFAVVLSNDAQAAEPVSRVVLPAIRSRSG